MLEKTLINDKISNNINIFIHMYVCMYEKICNILTTII